MTQVGRDGDVIVNLQALRALAAFMVIFVHLEQLLAVLGLPIFGWGGVDIFFVISGFIMVHTTRQARPSGWAFFKNRIARIAPLYWLLTGVVFAIALVAPSLLQATRADWSELVRSLLFIPFAKSDGQVKPVLFLGWTLNYEMFFYAVFAFGLMARNYLWGCLGVMAVLTALVLVRLVTPIASGGDSVWSVLAYFYTSPLLLEFVMGMGLALLVDWIPARSPAPALTRPAIIVVCAVCIGLVIAAPFILGDVSSVISCGLPAMVLVALAVAADRWGWRITNPIILLIGDASYALYLSHPFVTQAAQKAGRMVDANAPVAVALIVAALIGACVFAVLLHKFVERPLSHWARRLLNGPSAKPAIQNAG